ncbi:piezo-type mechanosensitive ion channel component isoform X8 [Eurosta solidaginis]|uniref:piezo-type mechanosensitive ion channel component isoform X8 n=1 Tax=Eurosta solidaginis TaxID=178769 RepID=UPI0035309178
MAVSYGCLAIQYFVVPTVLVLAALFRPAGISFVYLLMFFITPFIPIANNRNFKGSVGPFFIILIALCALLLLCHIVLQVTIIAVKIDSIFSMCSFTQQLLRHIGFINLKNLHPMAAIEWHAPDMVVFITVVISFIIIKKLTQQPPPIPLQLEIGEIVTIPLGETENNSEEEAFFDGLLRISPLFCLSMLFIISILRPSAPAGFYFLIFLLSGSYWATYRSLRRGFSLVLRLVMLVIVVHSVCIVAYQTPWAQRYLSSDNLIARLLALEPLVLSSCERDIRVMSYNLKYSFDSFILPVLMLLTYFVLALTAKCLSNANVAAKFKPAKGQLENGSKLARQISRVTTHSSRNSKKDSWTRAQRLTVSLRRDQRPKSTIEPTETTPLVKRLRKSEIKDSTVGEISSDVSIQSPDIFTNTICDQICYGFRSIGQFIYQNSYIFTNISMMTWAIIYHSWLTFVLLLWANILWMIPNQRKAMMRSSPFIVCYAEFLLIAQYIYGMDLKNDELPAKVDTAGINLQQIGLERPQEHGTHPCVPVIVKTLFLLMFWITSRQFFQEKTEEKRKKNKSPTSMALETIDSEDSIESKHKHTSKVLKKMGDIVKNLLVRLWIWMLVLVIFLCAMTGKFMTGFRICYMALFLFFLLVFQSSSKIWVKVMYGFWLFIIFYAMSMLILIYTYQFDKFDLYWSEYLNISQTLQNDIGLEQFKTKDLFLHLVSPTLIVILTVIQVHYFHRRFIESLQHHDSQIIRNTVDGRHGSQKSSQSERPNKDAKRLLVSSLKRLRNILSHYFIVSKKLFWRFLEIHIIKAVYLTAFICAVNQVCILNVIFVALCVLGCISRTSIQIFISRIISFVVSIIILTKMIYQIGYINHEDYNVTCSHDNETHGNSAEWFGLQKADDTTNGLIGLIKMYIIYMIVVTLHAVVTLRQFQMRAIHGHTRMGQAKVLFPGTDRTKAETNLKSMIQYLFNYGFYKFGQEVSLIMLVATIAYRQDIVALSYATWLTILLMFSRKRRSSVWGIFQVFIALCIFLQYMVFLGLPPSLCLDYPWQHSRFSAPIQGWVLLPGDLHYNHAKKLIFDFILLMIVTRQKRNYNFENKFADSYPGGSNRNIVKHIEQMGRVPFVNPTNDFLTHVRNYLDIFMYTVLCGFYWVTLATVFLAGTNMSDFLTLGYLIGAFTFLWEGSDFYLRPIHQILNRWRWLIIYNVFNIVVKTGLEMVGCFFFNDLSKHCCWLIHLLGVSCAFRTDLHKEAVADTDGECPEVNKSSILVWDTICFAFLILQMRIFKSHYFCHLIIDTKANSILATRGADIIEDLRQKQIEHRQLHENEILEKIKRKMERIRATQQKMLKPIDRPTHFDEAVSNYDETKIKPALNRRAPLDHEASLTSYQVAGYHSPVDDASTNSEADNDYNDTGSNDSTEESLQIIDNDTVQQKIRIECGDYGVSVVGNDYDDDVLSESENADNALAEDVTAHVRLPEIYIRAHTQPTTPSSDRTTIPLDGFLDVQRLSFGSGPSSDLAAVTREETSEASNEVFAPSTYRTLLHTLVVPATTSCSLNVNVSGASSNISSNLIADATPGSSIVRHRRQSSVNAVSWNETVSVQCAPDENTDPAEDPSVELPVTMREKLLHRRHLSLGNATYQVDERSNLQDGNRRYSNISWARDAVTQRAKARPHSWGPISTAFYMDSLMCEPANTTLHGQSVRAGDYYMFEDVDDKFELDVIEDEQDFLSEQESERKLQRRRTVINTDTKRKSESGPSTSQEAKVETEVEEQKKKSDVVDSDDSEGDLGANPIARLLEGFLVSITIALHRLSRNYRYVNKIMSNEKRLLKETHSVNLLMRPSGSTAYVNIKVLSPSSNEKPDATSSIGSASTDTQNETNTRSIPHNITNVTDLNTSTITSDTTPPPSIPDTQAPQQQQEQAQDPHEIIEISTDTVDNANNRGDDDDLPVLQRSHSLDMLEEDFTAREHNIIIEFLISLWYAILSNTDIVCYLVVFINQVVNASIISLPLPLMVFLWGTLSLPRPTKTFWVTLIAYTQAIVLIKCIFQYKLIWANYINLPNEPLSPAKIFGVELNPHYASYDLLLLLVLFFHRFILKSHGLWKSEYKMPPGHMTVNTTNQIGNESELPGEDSKIIRIEQLAKTSDLMESDSARRRGIIDKPVSEEESVSSTNATTNGTAANSNGNANIKEGQEKESENDSDHRKEGGAEDMIEPNKPGSDSLGSNSSQTYKRRIKHLKRAKYMSSVRKFFTNLLSKSRLPTDVYALMFLCDFVNFFVLLFGFTAFGSQQSDSAGGVQTYLEENKVPIPFLIMLLVQFILIVVDRALYLRKALLHKIIFHFFSVIGIHIWMFFIVPAVTERSFYSLAPPIIFYIIKCFYILLSSYQIKCGYPKRILGNFLTKSFSLVNMISFKVYMAIPFLYELRTILDWVCTDSTMTLFDWLKMEDIFADIYFIKCSRQMETDFPAIRATKKPIYSKLFMGGLFIIAIVIALWGPLCIFALGNAVGQSNTPLQVSISIRIGSYAPIYQTNTRDNIIVFDESMYADMRATYVKDRAAITFLSSYDASDIAAIKLPANSPSLWSISPPDRNRLLDDLKSNGTIVASFAYSITRIPPDKNLMGTVSSEINFNMNDTFDGREDLIRMLEANGTATTKAVVIPDLVPKFVKILNSGDVQMVHQLMSNGQMYRPLVIRMRTSSSARIWWEIADFCDDAFHKEVLTKLPLDKCNAGIVSYTFNDKKFPSTFSFITKGGILGVYTTFVIVASRFFKSFIGGQNRKIMFEDMPYVDRVLQLCLDIYLVREALEFALEEDLFAKLIFLYRSPETMIKWTRPKEEADDETDTESLRSRVSQRPTR